MNIVKIRKEDKDIVQFNGREYHATLSLGLEKYLYKITSYVHEHLIINHNDKLIEQSIRSFKEYDGSNVLVRFTMHGDREGIEIMFLN